MSNIFGPILIFFGILLAGQDVVRSLDCISGHKAACEIVAKRYEAKP